MGPSGRLARTITVVALTLLLAGCSTLSSGAGGGSASGDLASIGDTSWVALLITVAVAILAGAAGFIVRRRRKARPETRIDRF
ncbi:hypothetical protein B7R21_15120 [Subtercola boreus]|uniref:Gram-positive cocci surface proteins LPxTG domain-containing protein n=1 Tax=Subtercola boreus TaxID=120213 RepID=A0A3E0VCY9_9MICO|nr:LPXTG cell wall anchor domain-containing protein [Subtercola boreus]RFA07519.1 hypothetical protein B7R21_15120 [Subtercola boreus]